MLRLRRAVVLLLLLCVPLQGWAGFAPPSTPAAACCPSAQPCSTSDPQLVSHCPVAAQAPAMTAAAVAPAAGGCPACLGAGAAMPFLVGAGPAWSLPAAAQRASVPRAIDFPQPPPSRLERPPTPAA
jgi:hypothetical protein